MREVVGIDISAEMVAQARANAAERGLRVRFLVADIADLEPDERFELITMLNMPPFLARVVALLRPGGLVINASWHGPGTPFYHAARDACQGLRAAGLRSLAAERAGGDLLPGRAPASDQPRPCRYPSVLACLRESGRECCLGNAP